MPTPEEWLDLIEKRASRLRAAGVTHVELEGFKVDLAAPEPPEIVIANAEPPAPDYSDPLDDPATYGRRDGSVPGFRRRLPEGDA